MEAKGDVLLAALAVLLQQRGGGDRGHQLRLIDDAGRRLSLDLVDEALIDRPGIDADLEVLDRLVDRTAVEAVAFAGGIGPAGGDPGLPRRIQGGGGGCGQQHVDGPLERLCRLHDGPVLQRALVGVGHHHRQARGATGHGRGAWRGSRRGGNGGGSGNGNGNGNGSGALRSRQAANSRYCSEQREQAGRALEDHGGAPCWLAAWMLGRTRAGPAGDGCGSSARWHPRCRCCRCWR